MNTALAAEIRIDPTIQAHMLPLRPDEVAQLEENIVRHGCQSPLIVWTETNILLDGHNRYEICMRRRLSFAVEYIGLADIDEALAWVEENQLGRRNLTPDQFAYFIGRKYERMKKAHGGARTVASEEGPSDQNDHLKTAERIATEHGISAPTVRRAADYAKDVDAIATELGDGARAEILAGMPGVTRADVAEVAEQLPGGANGLSFSSAKEVFDWVKDRRAERAEERRAENEALKATVKAVVPEGKYGTIVVDPPWPMEKIERDVRPNQVGFDYPTMTVDELAEWSTIANMAADDCHLFCWTTQKFFLDAVDLIKRWGFRYILQMIWRKSGGFQPVGLPQYNCEFVIYGRRGSPTFEDTKAFLCCFDGERREHSRKPAEFYNLIRRVTASPRADVFSREEHAGFAAFGNEIGKFTDQDGAADWSAPLRFC